ncbi:MAG: hypothetical protein R3C56_07050 [Pirellulaceae bacterium]
MSRTRRGKHSPSEWLLAVSGGTGLGANARIFTFIPMKSAPVFDLEPHSDFHHSLNERGKTCPNSVQRSRNCAKGNRDPKSFDFFLNKLAAMGWQLNTIDPSFIAYQLPPIPDPGDKPTEEQRQQFLADVMKTFEVMQNIEAGGPWLFIPHKVKRPRGEDR